MIEEEINISGYNAEDVRMCRGCYQQFQTQEGILDNSYKFTCPPCHKFYKCYDWGIFILILVIIFSPIIWLLKLIKDKEDRERDNE